MSIASLLYAKVHRLAGAALLVLIVPLRHAVLGAVAAAIMEMMSLCLVRMGNVGEYLWFTPGAYGAHCNLCSRDSCCCDCP